MHHVIRADNESTGICTGVIRPETCSKNEANLDPAQRRSESGLTYCNVSCRTMDKWFKICSCSLSTILFIFEWNLLTKKTQISLVDHMVRNAISQERMLGRRPQSTQSAHRKFRRLIQGRTTRAKNSAETAESWLCWSIPNSVQNMGVWYWRYLLSMCQILSS